MFPANTQLSILIGMGEKKGSKKKEPHEGQRKRGGPGSVRRAWEVEGSIQEECVFPPLILLIIQDYNNRAILLLV